jgi:hypothetical protein
VAYIPRHKCRGFTPRWVNDAHVGAQLKLRGWLGRAWIPFEALICEGVVEHDESTDRTNGDNASIGSITLATIASRTEIRAM